MLMLNADDAADAGMNIEQQKQEKEAHAGALQAVLADCAGAVVLVWWCCCC